MPPFPYIEPGVDVEEIVGTSVSPILAGPTSLCIIGLSSGTILGTDQVTLAYGDADNDPLTPNAPVPVLLRNVPIDATLNGVTRVRDSLNGIEYVANTDYTVQNINRTITPVAGSAIADGTIVTVSYTYTPTNYFAPYRCDSIQAVEERYGSSWTSD
jgi:hypothetical protein